MAIFTNSSKKAVIAAFSDGNRLCWNVCCDIENARLSDGTKLTDKHWEARVPRSQRECVFIVDASRDGTCRERIRVPPPITTRALITALHRFYAQTVNHEMLKRWEVESSIANFPQDRHMHMQTRDVWGYRARLKSEVADGKIVPLWRVLGMYVNSCELIGDHGFVGRLVYNGLTWLRRGDKIASVRLGEITYSFPGQSHTFL